MTFTNANPTQLRRQLRQQRLQLSKRQRYHAAYQALSHLMQLHHLAFNSNHTKVGLFVDAFGEMPTQPLLDWAKKRGYKIYLPVVTGKNQPLVFIEFTQKTWLQSRLPRHPLGMRQPEKKGKALKACELDILFMPLVAADKFGNRMGMGGGYYDRTLAKAKPKPLKIGWAYNFQMVERLHYNPWDIQLDALVTPNKLWLFRRYLMEQPSMPSNDNIPSTQLKALACEVIDQTENDKGNAYCNELSTTEIASVMNPERLTQLLTQADAFTIVNSEDLDDF